MGLFDSLKATTPLYGIPNWAGKQYQFYRRLHAEASEGSIADTIFFNRYERQNPRFNPSEAAKFTTYYNNRSVMIQSIFDLCMIMYDIECQINPSSDPIMYQKAATIALEGLFKAGCGSHPSNVLDFANRWYRYMAEGNTNRLERDIRSSMVVKTAPEKATSTTTAEPDNVYGATEDEEENWVECICGLRYSRKETRCPACGEELINAPAEKEGQIKLVECPSCGAQLSSKDHYCPNCGTPMVEPIEVDGPVDNNECPFCHAHFSNEANICPEFGELIDGVTDDEEEPIESIECPRCGARFSNEEVDCPACGKSVVERSEEEPAPSVSVECLYCNAQFSGEQGVCPNCGENVLVYKGGDATFLSSKEQLRSAYRFRLKGDFRKALGAAEEALRLSPDFLEALRIKADLLNELGRKEEALETYEISTSLWPNNSRAWQERATYLRRLGSIKEAFDALDKALELDQDFAYAWIERGRLYLGIGKLSEALISYDQALEIEPRSAKTMYEKGFCLAKLKRYREASEVFSAAMGIEPPISIDAGWAAHCLRQLGRTEEALGLVVKAIEKDPDNHHLWKGKSIYLGILGRDEEAQAALNRSDELRRIN